MNVDHSLFRRLNDYIFLNKSLSELIETYMKKYDTNKDKDGKKLFRIIDAELRERRVERSEMINIIVDYLFEKKDASLTKLTGFLKEQMES